MMYVTTILVLAAVSVASSELPTQFGSMVFHLTNRHPNDYSSYGCWCGANATAINNNITVDETDSCCKIQAECYENIQVTDTSCTTNGKYHAIYHDGQIQCADNDGTSNYDLCMCDKRAAECFKRSLSTFDLYNNNISSTAVCQPETIHVCAPACPAHQVCSNGVCVGSGQFGISLTWSRAGDGDIIVITPSGKSIMFQNKGPSVNTDQGQLDHDDQNGTGPENVFWNQTAPSGIYHICFNEYVFSPPASNTNPITAVFQIRKPRAEIQTLIKKSVNGARLSTTLCNPGQATYVGSVNYP
jgi:hypothetical protein